MAYLSGGKSASHVHGWAARRSRSIDQLTRKATFQVTWSMRRRSINGRVVRMMTLDFVLAKTPHPTLQMGHMTTRSIHS